MVGYVMLIILLVVLWCPQDIGKIIAQIEAGYVREKDNENRQAQSPTAGSQQK